jgi:hypothetical protein
MDNKKCDICGKSSWGMVIIEDPSGRDRHLCRDCHNELVAASVGIDNYTDFIRTYQVKDIEGNMHSFEIGKHIFPTGVKWIASEIRRGKFAGYQFGVHADLEDDPVECLQELYAKINEGLSKIYVKKERGHGGTFYTLPHDKIVGRIEWDDDHNGEIPKIIIDGKPYTWHEVGKMIMSYEGWNLTIKISEVGERDKTE